MRKTMYIQTNKSGVITDAVSMPCEGYIQAEVDMPLPEAVLGGGYKWEEGGFVPNPDYVPITPESERIDALEAAILELAALQAEVV